jgi:hypothetical protein
VPITDATDRPKREPHPTNVTHPYRLALMAFVIALGLLAFTWPAGRLEPRGLPVGIAGVAPRALARTHGYELHHYSTIAAGEHAIRSRDVYGTFAGDTTFVATGASPTVASILAGIAPNNRIVDLAPGTRSDPHVATIPALALPITLLGIFIAAFATFTTSTFLDHLLALLGGSILAGVIAALITHTWLEAIPGSWISFAAVVALGTSAVSAFVAALATRFGPRGIGVGAIPMVLIGNAWSGASTAPELLPQPAHTIGQLFPTGAAAETLRSVAWFGGAGSAGELTVLAVWAAAGTALLAALGRRRTIGTDVGEATPIVSRPTSGREAGP